MNTIMYQGNRYAATSCHTTKQGGFYFFIMKKTPDSITTFKNGYPKYNFFNLTENQNRGKINQGVFMNKYEMIMGTARAYMMLAKASKSQVYVLAGIKCLKLILSRDNTKTMEFKV